MIEQASVGRLRAGGTGGVGRCRIQVAVRVAVVGRHVDGYRCVLIGVGAVVDRHRGIVAYSDRDIRDSGVAQRFCVANLIDKGIGAGEAYVRGVGEAAVAVIDQASVGRLRTGGTAGVGRGRIQVAVRIGVVGRYVDGYRRF